MQYDPPPLILAFDTSAAHCAAVLVRGEACLAARTEAMDRGQAERLLPLLGELLAEAGHVWDDLGALAVVTGPGNFTGIRIAVAAARGLALGLGIPAVGVSRFEALAGEGPALVGLDDRRGGVAVQSFAGGSALGPPQPGWPGDARGLAPGAICRGAGATAAAAHLGLAAGSEDERADLRRVAAIAAARLGRSLAPPSPIYLRPADAAPARETAPALLDDA